MSIQEMAVENAEKRLKEIDKLDFAISAWADYDNGLTQGFKDGAKWAQVLITDRAVQWLKDNWREYIFHDADGMIGFIGWEKDFRKAMEE
jgi:hypothetical protein